MTSSEDYGHYLVEVGLLIFEKIETFVVEGFSLDTRLERFSPLGDKSVYYIYWKDVLEVWIKTGIGVDQCLGLISNCDQPINVKYVEDVLGERVDC